MSAVSATAVSSRTATSPPSARVFLGLDDVDAHLAEHGQGVFDGLGGDLLGRQDLVQLVHGDVAAGLGLLDELLDPGVGQVEQRPVGGGGRFGGSAVVVVVIQISSDGAWRARMAARRRKYGSRGETPMAPPL